MTAAPDSLSLHDHALAGDAQRHAIECLLNCYLREYALPRGEACLDARGQDLPMSLRQLAGTRVCIDLAGGRLAVAADRTSALGRCRFTSAPYFKGNGQGWRPLGVMELAQLLLAPLASAERHGELMGQIHNSLSVTRVFLRHAVPAQQLPQDSLLRSEQHQVWGHALHPTPKSREGVSLESLLACSPEVGARFSLHWFQVDPSLFRHLGDDPRATLRQLSGEEHLYPCHPWEVQRILGNPLVQRAMSRGLMSYRGALGAPLYPTSSVRTLYHPELAYFLKFSVHVRLTNCIRKNAWYELHSAVALTRLLRPAMADLARHQPGFELMPEPAASTLDLSALGSAEQAREVTECFGILYRGNFDAGSREAYRPQVAMALFTWGLDGHGMCASRLRQCAARLGLGREETAALWLQRYAGLLLGGVLHCLYRQGVVLEPHLQNTLLGFDDDGLPCRVWVRDLEGTKLVAGHWPEERLAGLDERTRASLYYSPEKAWKRVAYCALVNNLGEALFHLADGDAALERRLWTLLGEELRAQCARLGNPAELSGLCAGAALPSKENFMTRLLQRADREAGYTALPNPLFHGDRA
ncbi:iron transporter [Pseudomonas aeruginosa]|uniref:Iron transporter n=1 Tax=Pseudomonas paraeruginosa (strain DSM 24068 / PA7) TaxID=381754 RepID=A6V5W9_PSEP7|nr:MULTISPECIES: IucA/IucC family protein [Pseudomonas aeruginosa group]ABR81509.1 iron transporter [Pseudomonas aeruginosa PA7]KSC88726.1 iron transporter [Pseudomonas aeruginosa]KSD19227.1 iron transporter [Pseudomonas aeruginosa]KSG42969.1 iron transporter [Pseudomonas aeruginosa]MCW8362621.1 iron transporter [Pseudomonas aeruginosa]